MSDTEISRSLRASVIGTGHLGRHHTRILSQMPGVRFIGAFDSDSEQLQRITSEHGVTALGSAEAALEADAVVIATPTTSHCELAGRAFEHGCHVLVEKPIASTFAEAEDMVSRAAAAGRVLAVGHTEFHNPAVQHALDLITDVRYLEAQRLAPFTARSVDVDVILDLMIHDLQITLAVAGEAPSEIRAVGVPVLTDKVDLCHAWIEFPSGLVANLTASRVSAEPVRKVRLFDQEAYFSVGYADQSVSSVRLRRSEAGAEILPQQIEVTAQEPLRAELDAFIAACRGHDVPYVDGATGAATLAAAIAIRESVEKR